MNAISNQRRIVDRRSLITDIEGYFDTNGYEPSKRGNIVGRLKEALESGCREVQERFYSCGKGTDVLAGNAFLMDQLVRVIFDIATERVFPVANRSTSEQISVVAIGGYGRNELAPHSDIDLMLLHPYKQTPYIEQIVEFILYMLWDLGLKVGHSTRSCEDCIRLSKKDITIQTSLLDARFVWGDQAPFNDLRKRYKTEVVDRHGSLFVEKKLAERDDRHVRIGDSRYVLEPNIKDGKGGLRDLQTLYWLTRFLYSISNVSELVPLGVFTQQDVSRYTKAHDFLWSVRCHLHYLSGRSEERLSFDVQKIIGERMDYADDIGGSGVERFMKNYFLIAKDVGDLTRLLCAVLEDQQKKKPFFRLPSLSRRWTNIDGFIDDRGRINVDSDDAFQKNPLMFLRNFAEAQTHDVDIHPQALRLISRDLRWLDDGFCENNDANSLFLGILTSKNDPEMALRRMNEAGVFGKFIPDFGRVVAQMEFSMYHSYTVDEHTIRAIGILSRIEAGDYAHQMPNVTKAMLEIHSRRALYVALFLHDIAKGRGGDHSELGAELALNLCPRLGLDAEETETVSWLVKEHLTMSDIAFKRDFDDPKTIKDFVDIVKSAERLKLLTVLTCADIRAVGPKTWNSWKSGLLRGLYLRALENISGDMVTENRVERIALAKDTLRKKMTGWSNEALEDHISTGYPNYWLVYDKETHLRHAEIVRKAKSQNRCLYIDSRMDDEFEYSEITVYAPDHPGLFSEIAGAIALSNVTIMDAKIATMSDGMVLDTFALLDINERAVTQPKKVQRLFCRIEDTLAGQISLEKELAIARRSNRKKREESFTVASRVIINNQASSTDTVIEVNGRDRIGLLYDLTSALTRLGLKISSAHITTFGEEVVDTFYVKDVFGLKITHANKIKKVRGTLLAAVIRNTEGLTAAAE